MVLGSPCCCCAQALEPSEKEVLEHMMEVATARRAAIMELTENGFLEREKARRDERKAERMEAMGGGASEDDDGGDEADEEDGDEPAAYAAPSPLPPTAAKQGKLKGSGSPGKKKSAGQSGGAHGGASAVSPGPVARRC